MLVALEQLKNKSRLILHFNKVYLNLDRIQKLLWLNRYQYSCPYKCGYTPIESHERNPGVNPLHPIFSQVVCNELAPSISDWHTIGFGLDDIGSPPML